MYREFSTEHGLAMSTPMSFSIYKYRDEIKVIETSYHRQFGAVKLVKTSQVVLMQKFFDSIASCVKKCTDSIDRVHVAIDSLEEKIHAVKMLQGELIAQRNTLTTLENDFKSVLDAELATMKVAGTIVAYGEQVFLHTCYSYNSPR
jgi:hypothetical protein